MKKVSKVIFLTTSIVGLGFLVGCGIKEEIQDFKRIEALTNERNRTYKEMQELFHDYYERNIGKKIADTAAHAAVPTYINDNLIASYSTEQDEKLFDVGQHTIQVSVAPHSCDDMKFMQFDCVDGYEIISTSVLNYANDEDSHYYSLTYQNIVPVMVDSVWNEDGDYYDYSSFGTPMDLEQNEDLILKLSK